MKVLLLFLLAPAALPAQVLISGDWQTLMHEDQPERGQGPDLGDYLGIPINDAARLRADSWDASRLTLQEHQCRVHVAPYIYFGPLQVRVWEEKDPDTQQVIAIKHYISTYEQTRTIWMDGRPHPSEYAPHTFMGFSTGKWEGDVLTVETTHLKQGWLRRNGLPESDQATMVEHFLRHGDYLTHVSILKDPVYLTEPLIKTQTFRMAERDPGNWLWPCEYVEEVVGRPKGAVPNFLPGQNPFLKEFPQRHGLPEQATRGGAETMYPEYRTKLRAGTAPQPSALSPREPATRDSAKPGIEILPVQGNVYLLTNAGANITFQAGKTGVLLVDSGNADTGNAPMTPQVLAAIRKITDKPVRYLINTTADPDHTGGNANLAGTFGSATTVAVANTPGSSATQTVQIYAHDNVLSRMTAAKLPSIAWPTETYIGDSKELYFNGEAVLTYHVPSAHTDGDSIVHFRASDVISAGDIFNTTSYPVIDLQKGGTLQGIIDGLNHILDIAVPAHHEEGGTYIIPGHGRICDEFDVVEYRDMLTIIRDRITAAIKNGMSLEQVQTARLTRDYDPQYGATTGPWTTAMFVENAYRSLVPKH